MRIFHGTSYENYLKILEEGFKPKNKNWSCSCTNYMYFYDPKRILEDREADTMEEAVDKAIRYAFENGQIAAASQRSTADKVIVMELHIRPTEVMDDTSCECMSTACSVNAKDLSPKMIKKVYFTDFVSNISLMYLTSIYRSTYFNTKLSDLELLILESLSREMFFMNELLISDYQEYSEPLKEVV